MQVSGELVERNRLSDKRRADFDPKRWLEAYHRSKTCGVKPPQELMSPIVSGRRRLVFKGQHACPCSPHAGPSGRAQQEEADMTSTTSTSTATTIQPLPPELQLLPPQRQEPQQPAMAGERTVMVTSVVIIFTSSSSIAVDDEYCWSMSLQGRARDEPES